MSSVTMSVKQMQGGFLDRKKVVDAVGKARAKVMARQGAIVRSIAKNSMRKKKGASAPGEPPHAHKATIKRLLYFAYDSARMVVVVGPAKLGESDPPVPGKLEKGFTLKVKGIIGKGNKFVPLKMLKPKTRALMLKQNRVVQKSIRVAPRPYMAPALKKSKPLLAKPWRGAVRK